ncbi:MAG: mechanosensitive ion channel domain-containing protein [Halochromatium sp.]
MPHPELPARHSPSEQAGQRTRHQPAREHARPTHRRAHPAAHRGPCWAQARAAAGVVLGLLLLLGAAADPTGLLIASATAQPERAAEAPLNIQASVTREQVETKLSELAENQDLPAETRQRLSERYRDILAHLDTLSRFQTQAMAYFDALETAPAEAAALRAELAELESPRDPPVDLPADISIDQIEQRLAREQAEAASLEAQLSKLNDNLSQQSDRLTNARRRLGEIPLLLSALEDALKQPQPEEQPDALRQARTWALESERDALRAERLMLEQRILSAEVRRQLAEAQRAQHAAQLQRSRLRRTYLEHEADRLRTLEAERTREETTSAERALSDADPVVLELAQRNRQISETISEVTAALTRLDEEQSRLEERLRKTESDFENARARISAAGLSQAVGQILVDERTDLPDPSSLREDARARAAEIAQLTLSQLRLRDKLSALADIDAASARKLIGKPVSAPLQAQVREQLLRQRDLLERALRLKESYQRAIADLDFVADQYADLVKRYRDFLAENLLWVRNAAPITQQPFAPLPQAVWWLVAPDHWASVLRAARQAAATSTVFWLGLLSVLGLLAASPFLHRRIRDYAEPMRRISTDRFAYSLSALGLTLLLALPWPLLAAVLGWALHNTPRASAFVLAVGQGLLTIALPFYYLRAFRLLCMRGGVAARHFRWNSESLEQLRHGFKLAALLLLPIGFVAETIGSAHHPAFDGTLGRLALMLLCLGLSALTAWLLHPSGGVFKHQLAAQPTAWLSRSRLLWYPLVVAMPAALAALALAGFIYTAGTLLTSVAALLWLALALVVFHQMVARWLVLTRRGLALEAALERRAQREAQREAQEQGAQWSDANDDPVDLAALDSQTRQLLNSSIAIIAAVGFWMIWSDVLPALNQFDGITLWSYTAEIDGVEELVPVTLGDLGMILVLAGVALIAVKNLPALLEILLLKNTEISTSARYTLVTLTRYLVTAIGLLLVVGALGLQWSQVQWLIAALSVGIGFGLQEIVANFISGLIILFERPVRVGDTVTIGDITGTVTRIQIRATTIRNWDKQELLVPNKEFITGRLLNWTLSDQVNRLVIPVGVAHGSDTGKALALLAEVAAEHPKVLADPEPVITFEGFGEHALNLVLRCYLDSLDFRLPVISELHQAIEAKFGAAGIQIALPQRHVELRAPEPLALRLRREQVPARHASASDPPASGSAASDPATSGSAASDPAEPAPKPVP